MMVPTIVARDGPIDGKRHRDHIIRRVNLYGKEPLDEGGLSGPPLLFLSHFYSAGEVEGGYYPLGMLKREGRSLGFIKIFFSYAQVSQDSGNGSSP